MRTGRPGMALLAGAFLIGAVAPPAAAHTTCATSALILCTGTDIAVSGQHCHIAWTSPPPVQYWCYANFTSSYYFGVSTLPGTLTSTLSGSGASGSWGPCAWPVNGSCRQDGLSIWPRILVQCNETAFFEATSTATATTPAGSVADPHAATTSVRSPSSPC